MKNKEEYVREDIAWEKTENIQKETDEPHLVRNKGNSLII